MATKNQAVQLGYKFALFVDGFEVAFVQKLTLGKAEVEDSVYVDGDGFDVYQPGRQKLGETELEGVLAADGSDIFYLWFTQATGENEPTTLKRTVVIEERNILGVPVVRHELLECYVKAYDPGELDATSSDPKKRKVTLRPYKYRRTTLL
jgi:phage tail-like protein